jgi:septal ring-binding cell division protein DamX/Mrp family chromosome partitioning ATPase
MTMSGDERGKTKSGRCEAVRGGYTIFLDEERMRSFLEEGDFSSGSELDHFKDVGAQIEQRVKEKNTASFLALSIGERSVARDFAVLHIAHFLAKHGRSVHLVDCDFLHPGLSGLVEDVEEQGFLDLLLYGSSLKTVAKPIGIEGVSVTGPGSFPVSRTVPFALKEFSKVQEFLRSKHEVVIYCSTLETEDAKLNPLANLVDGIILSCRIDEMGEGELEQKLRSLGAERVPPVELICFCAGKEEAAAVAGAKQISGRPAQSQAPPVARKAPPAVATPPAAPVVIDKNEDFEPLEPVKKKPHISILRLAGIIGAVLIAAFIVWWALVSRTFREKESPSGQAVVAEQEESSGGSTAPAAVPAESLGLAQTGGVDTTGERRSPAESAEAPFGKAGERAGASETGQARDTLRTQAPAGPARFTIHVSSFKETSRAETEKAYLEANGYSARILEVTIKDEKWLRVFVGEYATMEEASKARLDLLGLRRIGYARIVAIDNEAR